MSPLFFMLEDQSKRRFVSILLAFTCWLLILVFPAYAQQQSETPKTPTPANAAIFGKLGEFSLPQEIARTELPSPTVEYEFRDVEIIDIREWIEYFGIEVPFALDGRVSGWFYGLRQGGIFDLGQYRFEAEIVSNQFTIEDWEIQHSRVRFGYENGVWYLFDLSGQLVQESTAEPDGRLFLGSANLSAEYPVDDGPFRLQGGIDSVDVKRLTSKLGIELPLNIESGNLRFRAENQTRNDGALTDWQAVAELERTRFDYEGIEFESSNSEVVYDRGHWRLLETDIATKGGIAKLRGQGSFLTEDPNATPTKINDVQYQIEIDSPGIDLSKVLKQSEFEAIAHDLAGALAVVGEISGRNDEYFIDLRFESNNVAFRDVRLKSLRSQFISNPRAAILNLPNLSLEMGGEASAQIHWPNVFHLSEFPRSAEVRVTQLPVQFLEIASLADSGLENSSGLIDGSIEIKSLADSVSRSIRSQLLVSDLKIGGAKLGLANFVIPNQSINLTGTNTIRSSLSLQNEGGIAAGSLQLNAEEFEIERAQFDLQFEHYTATLDDAKFTLNGGAHLTGEVGSGRAMQWPQSGEVSLAGSSFEVGSRAINVDSCKLTVTPVEFQFDELQLTSDTGTISANAIVAREPNSQHHGQLEISGIDIEQLQREFSFQSQFPLAGNLKTSIDVSANSSDNWLRDLQSVKLWSGRFNSLVRDFRFAGTSPAVVQVAGELAEGAATGKLTSNLFGSETVAKFRLNTDGLLNPSVSSQPKRPTIQFSARIIGARVDDIATLAYLPRDAQKFGGRVSLGIDLAACRQRIDSARVEVFAPKVTWSRVNLTEQLDIICEYNANDKLIRIQDVSGRFGGGRLRAEGAIPIDLNDGELARGGQIRFSMERVAIPAITTLIAPEHSDDVTGFVSYRGRATFNRGIQLSGTALLDDGLVYGMPVQNITGRTQITLSEFGEIKKIAAENLHGTAFDGSVDGSIIIRGGTDYALEASAKLGNGRIDQLSRALGFENVIGRGKFDGQFQLESKRIEQLDELTGAVRISFESSNSGAIPVLSELARLGPFSTLASTTVESGRLDATIGAGQVRVNDLLITSPAFWLAATGTAGLVGGRLDLQGVVQTGGGFENQFADTAIRGLASKAVPALAIANEINEAIRNRSLFFEVDGTTNHLIVRPRAAQTIGKALIQEFSRQAIRSLLGVSSQISPNT